MLISNFNLQLQLFITTVTFTVNLQDLTRDVQMPVRLTTVYKKIS